MDPEFRQRLRDLESSITVAEWAASQPRKRSRWRTLAAAAALAGAIAGTAGAAVHVGIEVVGTFGPDPRLAALNLRCTVPAEADRRIREAGLSVAVWQLEDRRPRGPGTSSSRSATPPSSGLVFDATVDREGLIHVIVEIGDPWLDHHCSE